MKQVFPEVNVVTIQKSTKFLLEINFYYGFSHFDFGGKIDVLIFLVLKQWVCYVEQCI